MKNLHYPVHLSYETVSALDKENYVNLASLVIVILFKVCEFIYYTKKTDNLQIVRVKLYLRQASSLPLHARLDKNQMAKILFR